MTSTDEIKKVEFFFLPKKEQYWQPSLTIEISSLKTLSFHRISPCTSKTESEDTSRKCADGETIPRVQSQHSSDNHEKAPNARKRRRRNFIDFPYIFDRTKVYYIFLFLIILFILILHLYEHKIKINRIIVFSGRQLIFCT